LLSDAVSLLSKAVSLLSKKTFFLQLQTFSKPVIFFIPVKKEKKNLRRCDERQSKSIRYNNKWRKSFKKDKTKQIRL